jgi:hypothetical protein
MKARENMLKLVALVIIVLLVMSCLLPGMIPMTLLPKMEKNADAVLEVLNGKDWYPLESLAKEHYTEEDFAKPGTLTFTVENPNDKPVFFSYGWCAKDDQVLKQNLEHIEVRLYLNNDELGTDVVHNVSFKMNDGQSCSDFGVLFSEWPVGEYKLKAVASFDGKINDGFADYEAGDYIFEYNVTVKEQKESVENAFFLS